MAWLNSRQYKDSSDSGYVRNYDDNNSRSQSHRNRDVQQDSCHGVRKRGRSPYADRYSKSEDDRRLSLQSRAADYCSSRRRPSQTRDSSLERRHSSNYSSEGRQREMTYPISGISSSSTRNHNSSDSMPRDHSSQNLANVYKPHIQQSRKAAINSHISLVDQQDMRSKGHTISNGPRATEYGKSNTSTVESSVLNSNLAHYIHPMMPFGGWTCGRCRSNNDTRSMWCFRCPNHFQPGVNKSITEGSSRQQCDDDREEEISFSALVGDFDEKPKLGKCDSSHYKASGWAAEPSSSVVLSGKIDISPFISVLQSSHETLNAESLSKIRVNGDSVDTVITRALYFALIRNYMQDCSVDVADYTLASTPESIRDISHDIPTGLIVECEDNDGFDIDDLMKDIDKDNDDAFDETVNKKKDHHETITITNRTQGIILQCSCRRSLEACQILYPRSFKEDGGVLGWLSLRIIVTFDSVKSAEEFISRNKGILAVPSTTLLLRLTWKENMDSDEEDTAQMERKQKKSSVWDGNGTFLPGCRTITLQQKCNSHKDLLMSLVRSKVTIDTTYQLNKHLKLLIPDDHSVFSMGYLSPEESEIIEQKNNMQRRIKAQSKAGHTNGSHFSLPSDAATLASDPTKREALKDLLLKIYDLYDTLVDEEIKKYYNEHSHIFLDKTQTIISHSVTPEVNTEAHRQKSPPLEHSSSTHTHTQNDNKGVTNNSNKLTLQEKLALKRKQLEEKKANDKIAVPVQVPELPTVTPTPPEMMSSTVISTSSLEAIQSKKADLLKRLQAKKKLAEGSAAEETVTGESPNVNNNRGNTSNTKLDPLLQMEANRKAREEETNNNRKASGSSASDVGNSRVTLEALRKEQEEWYGTEYPMERTGLLYGVIPIPGSMVRTLKMLSSPAVSRETGDASVHMAKDGMKRVEGRVGSAYQPKTAYITRNGPGTPTVAVVSVNSCEGINPPAGTDEIIVPLTPISPFREGFVEGVNNNNNNRNPNTNSSTLALQYDLSNSLAEKYYRR